MTYGKLAVVATLLLIAGCSSHDGDGGASRVSDNLSAYLLTQSDFPSGAKYSRPSFDPRQEWKSLSDNLRISTVVPPECKGPREDQAQLIPGMKRAESHAAYQDREYGENITRNGEPAGLLRRLYTGACSNVTIDRHLPNGITDTMVNHITTIAQPAGIKGGNTMVIQQTSTQQSQIDPSPRIEKAVSGVTYVRGLQVALQMSYDPKTQPNMDEFNRLFKAAVDKVSNPT